MLANLLRHADSRLAVHLIVNKAGDGDAASHFQQLDGPAHIDVQPLNVGLPVDLWQPRSRVLRLLARSTHRLRRERVVKIARALDIDLVYTSQQRFDCQLGALVARRLGVPHVVHLHYTPGPWLRRPALRQLLTCDQVIAVSEFIRREVIATGTDPGRVSVISNTIDVPANAVDHEDRDGVVIGQVGRMHPGKGFPESVEVFARVHEQHPDTSLLLVGDGPERPVVEQLVRRHGLADAVRLVGWQEEVDGWLGQIDIFLHPSRAEPFGLAVLEAMAVALPVVAYGDAGVSEIVEDGVTGYLLEPGDIDGLEAAVSRLVADPVLRRRLGAAGRERARTHFQAERAGAELLPPRGGDRVCRTGDPLGSPARLIGAWSRPQLWATRVLSGVTTSAGPRQAGELAKVAGHPLGDEQTGSQLALTRRHDDPPADPAQQRKPFEEPRTDLGDRHLVACRIVPDQIYGLASRYVERREGAGVRVTLAAFA